MASGGSFYEWDNAQYITGSNLVPNPVVSPDSTTTYNVTVTDANGCTDVASINICVIEDPLSVLEAVTVITPNGDGLNDVLEFRGLEAFPENRLVIFNRWGGILFEKRGYQIDGQYWEGLRDGSPLPADTYYYILEFAEFTIENTLTIIRE